MSYHKSWQVIRYNSNSDMQLAQFFKLDYANLLWYDLKKCLYNKIKFWLWLVSTFNHSICLFDFGHLLHLSKAQSRLEDFNFIIILGNAIVWVCELLCMEFLFRIPKARITWLTSNIWFMTIQDKIKWADTKVEMHKKNRNNLWDWAEEVKKFLSSVCNFEEMKNVPSYTSERKIN